MPPRSEIFDRTPPHDLTAERQLIGSVLINPDKLDEVGTMILPADFYADAHRTIFAAVAALHEENRAVDTTLLLDRLRSTGQLEAVGGVLYVAEIAANTPVSGHAAYYAGIVARHAKYRHVIHAALDALQASYAAAKEPTAILESLEAELSTIRTGDYTGRPQMMQEAVTEALVRIDRSMTQKTGPGTMLGLHCVDEQFGGLLPGEVMYLAARPGVGKTTLACQFAEHNGLKGRLVYFASLEMKGTELATRMLCSASGVSARAVRTAELSDRDLDDLRCTGMELGRATIAIHHRPGLSVYDIRRESRRLKREGLALVIVDYLQRVTPLERRIPRHEQIGQITRDLKAMALELDVPVVCLCQLSRLAETETPRLGHLKDSGDIEQDADVVAFLQTNIKWTKDRAEEAEPHKAALRVEKMRNMAAANLRLIWDVQRGRFRDVDAVDMPNYEPAFGQPCRDF